MIIQEPSQAILTYLELNKKLGSLVDGVEIEEGEVEQKADILRDQMDPIWNQLTPYELTWLYGYIKGQFDVETLVAELKQKLNSAEFEIKILKDEATPTPANNPKISELHKLVAGWVERNQIPESEEIALLAYLLAGRSSVLGFMQRLRSMEAPPSSSPEM